MLEHLVLFVLGITAGLVGTPLGLGAALFIAPLLVFGYHLPLGQAVGTALAIGFLTAASGTATLFQYYQFDFRPVRPLALAGFAGTLLSSQVLSLPTVSRYPLLLGLLLTGNLAYVLLKRAWARSASFARRLTGRPSQARPPAANSLAWWVKAVLTALFAGGVSRSLGVGAGLVFVPFLVVESRLPLPIALAAAQAADVLVTFSGSLSFLHEGLLNFPLVVYVGAGGMVGAQIGVWVLAQCPPFVWGLAYGVTSLGLGAFLLALARPSLALPHWLIQHPRQLGLELVSLPIPGWLGLLIGTTTGAALLLAIHLVRTLWRQRDLPGSGCAGLGLAAFIVEFAVGFSHPSLHRRGAYALAVVYLLNLLYVIVKGDKIAVTLVAVGTGLLAVGIGLARIYLGGPLW